MFVIFSPFLILGQNTIPHEENSKEKVGWIKFDGEKDDTSFKICDEYNIHEYYQVNPRYGEGLKSIKEYFKSIEHNLDLPSSFSGYLTVRFVINCEGNVGRLRLMIVNRDYESVSIDFDSDLLNEIVRNMGSWLPGRYKGETFDSYKHIVFKIRDGKVIDIIA